MADETGYRDWRSLELAIKDSARAAVRQPGPGHVAGTVDARIRQARFDRFLCRVFASGEESEWLLKGGMSMLARVARSRSTKDIDLASGTAADLAEAERALIALVAVDLGDHLSFRLIRSVPTGMGDNQPGVLTRRLVFACLDADYDTHIDTIMVDIVVGPPPVGRPEVMEPANRLHLKRPSTASPSRPSGPGPIRQPRKVSPPRSHTPRRRLPSWSRDWSTPHWSGRPPTVAGTRRN